MLVDEDGDFTNGATSISPLSFNNATDIVYFQHDFNPTNGNNMTQNNGFFFTLGSTNFNLTPLPVNLTELTIDCENGDSTLNLEVLSEKDNDYFEVHEAGIDGVFELTHTIPSIGDHSSTHVYETNLYGNTQYVQVVQVDVNKSKTVFEIISVDCESGTSFELFPNPNSGIFTLLTDGLNYNNCTYQIIDLSGRVVKNGTVSSSSQIINFESAASGVYSLQVISNGLKFIEKLINK